MIYTVTPNPTYDQTLSVPKLIPGDFHRTQVLQRLLSGKGINVSRALKLLGIPNKTLGFVGGKTGEIYVEGLNAEGLDIDFVIVEDETRRNITLYDESNGVYTKINEPGSLVTDADIVKLYAQAETYTSDGDIWTLSGSLPPGAPVDFYGQIITRVQERNGKAFLDTSGKAFHGGMQAQPYGVKPNTHEASEYFGQRLESDDDHVKGVMRLLQSDGVQVAAITRGSKGLVLATAAHPGRVVIAKPPDVEAKSAVAAGDSALTGILWGMLDECDLETIARRGVAFGTATAMQEGSALGDLPLIESLVPQVSIEVAQVS